MSEMLSHGLNLLAAEEASGWELLLTVVAVIVLPFVLGRVIAQALRLKDLGGRIGLVLFTIVLGLAPFAYARTNADSWDQAIRNSLDLGIDLAGGTNMVFQARSDNPDKPITSEVMDQMVAAVGRRINPSGTEEITIRQVGADRIEVIVPGADRDKVEETKRAIIRLGSLEFAILANRMDHENLIQQAEQLPDSWNDLRIGGRTQAAWRPVGRDAAGNLKDVSEHGEVVTRTVQQRGEDVKQFLVVFEPERYRVTGEYLTRAYQTADESGSPAVGFVLNTKGGYLFQRLTSANRPRSTDGFMRRLAVLLDGQIHSAPNLKDVISNQGQISGQFSQEEINELINVLNAGALIVPIDPTPISEFSISPLLGHDVQEKGKTAIIIAAVTVFVFMAVYYLFAGLVADVCLLLNLILVLGAMAFIDATFTLPGLAGLVLTIGMAVDANVLIFERIREERRRGSSLRMSIQNGFDRAFTTIVDANVTTLITAIVLYMIGTDQIRGFAVTLFIGIVMSMYTALYFGRLIFEICERKRWLKDLKMFSLVGTTHWNFINKKMIAAAVSVAVIAIGMGALAMRGEDNLDIDFSGGTMVTFELQDQSGKTVPEAGEILDILDDQEALGTALSLEQLQTLEEAEQEGAATPRFRLRTKQQELDLVTSSIDQALDAAGYPLIKVTMSPIESQDIAPIPDAPETDVESADGEDAAPAAREVDPFAGGHQVKLGFSEPIKPSMIGRYIIEGLEKLQGDDGQLKYDSPENLVDVEPVGQDNADEQEVVRAAEMLLRVQPAVERSDLENVLTEVQSNMEDQPIFEEVNTFASSVAAEMRQTALLAMFFSLVAIVGYIWFRFQRITFGFAAVAALVHDVLVVLGMVALASYLHDNPFGRVLDLYDFKINLPMIAAFLTIVGYSLNDTIVVFDRIREVRGKNPLVTEEIVNTSLNQTLSRTLLTSLTTLIVVAILYAIGGEGIHGFAFCLVIGVIVGTYSSIFVASPILLWLMNREQGTRTQAGPPPAGRARVSA